MFAEHGTRVDTDVTDTIMMIKFVRAGSDGKRSIIGFFLQDLVSHVTMKQFRRIMLWKSLEPVWSQIDSNDTVGKIQTEQLYITYALNDQNPSVPFYPSDDVLLRDAIQGLKSVQPTTSDKAQHNLVNLQLDELFGPAQERVHFFVADSEMPADAVLTYEWLDAKAKVTVMNELVGLSTKIKDPGNKPTPEDRIILDMITNQLGVLPAVVHDFSKCTVETELIKKEMDSLAATRARVEEAIRTLTTLKIKADAPGFIDLAHQTIKEIDRLMGLGSARDQCDKQTAAEIRTGAAKALRNWETLDGTLKSLSEQAAEPRVVIRSQADTEAAAKKRSDFQEEAKSLLEAPATLYTRIAHAQLPASIDTRLRTAIDRANTQLRKIYDDAGGPNTQPQDLDSTLAEMGALIKAEEQKIGLAEEGQNQLKSQFGTLNIFKSLINDVLDARARDGIPLSDAPAILQVRDGELASMFARNRDAQFIPVDEMDTMGNIVAAVQQAEKTRLEQKVAAATTTTPADLLVLKDALTEDINKLIAAVGDSALSNDDIEKYRDILGPLSDDSSLLTADSPDLKASLALIRKQFEENRSTIESAIAATTTTSESSTIPVVAEPQPPTTFVAKPQPPTTFVAEPQPSFRVPVSSPPDAVEPPAAVVDIPFAAEPPAAVVDNPFTAEPPASPPVPPIQQPSLELRASLLAAQRPLNDALSQYGPPYKPVFSHHQAMLDTINDEATDVIARANTVLAKGIMDAATVKQLTAEMTTIHLKYETFRIEVNPAGKFHPFDMLELVRRQASGVGPLGTGATTHTGPPDTDRIAKMVSKVLTTRAIARAPGNVAVLDRTHLHLLITTTPYPVAADPLDLPLPPDTSSIPGKVAQMMLHAKRVAGH